MKKVLSLLLAFILIFSCFSILGTTAVLADEIITTVEDPVVLKSDFENNTASKWRQTRNMNGTTSSTSGITFTQEGGEYYAHIAGSSSYNNVGIASPTFELIPENEYELTLYFRLKASGTSTFYLSNFYYIPAFLFYETTNTVGTATTTGISEGASGNFYVYNGGNRSDKGYTAEWTIGDLPTVSVNNYSNFTYQNNNTLVNSTSLTHEQKKPENMYKDWTKVTAKIKAVGKNSSETAQKVAFAMYFNAGLKNANLSFDIKNVQLINKSVSGGADAPDLKADQAFFNDFKAGFVENIEADRSELTLVKEDSDINGDTQYLRYVSEANSNGVAFNFTNNPNYKYKISYDLKVGAKGSGTLKTTAASTIELFDHSNATGVWEHYEYDFTSATNGEVTVQLLADAAGWQVGIDNIKVEMVSNANLETADDITTGTYAFNIRSQSEDKGQGLRFKSSISFNKINLDEGAKIVEYGTLVTAATNKENLKLENVNDKTVLAGVAYNADEKKDIRYSFDNDTGELVYTGVITGITPKNYDKELAVCGYTVVKTVSGARFVIYDEVKEISVLGAAEQIVAESQSEDDKAAAQSVIDDYNAL